MIIGLDWVLGIRPSMGTALNILSYGPTLQFLLGILPAAQSPVWRWSMLLAGILVLGQGVGIYSSADLGIGPRDALMIGLTRRLGIPVAFAKNGIDIAVAVLGWFLGGPLGAGTVVVALGMGPSVQFGLAGVVRLATVAPFSGFVRPVALKRAV